MVSPKQPSPDWDSIQLAVACPLCEYNLRGLSEPRCPECGFEFEWDEVIDPKRQTHPYLFEHHPQRNVSSFFRTLIGGLRPSRFWTTLHPAQPSAPERLGWFALMVFLIALTPLAVGFFTIWPLKTKVYIAAATLRADFAQAFLRHYPYTVARQLFWLPLWRLLLVVAIWWTFLPIGSYLLLLIFQGTMQRLRIRGDHVLRCIVYSADILAWPSALILLLLVLNLPGALNYAITELICWVLLLALLGVWLGMTWRLMVAYRKYLRFHHAEAVILSVQVILLLVGMILLVAFRF